MHTASIVTHIGKKKVLRVLDKAVPIHVKNFTGPSFTNSLK